MKRGILIEFDLEPFVDWPRDSAWDRIHQLEMEMCIMEQAPSEKRRHYVVLKENARVERLLKYHGLSLVLGRRK